MKKVLVTGGSGFIGRHFISLIEKNYDVTNYDLGEGYDIRSAMPFNTFDYVVHFAALKSVPDSEANPHNFIDTNCWGTTNLAERYREARFINISSSAVNEVKSVYGATKQFAEAIVSRLPNALNIRLYNVFGEGQSLKHGGVLSKFINARLTGNAPVIYGDGEQTRDFTYVGDVVESILDLMKSTRTGLVHLGYGSAISVKRLLQEVYGYGVPQYVQMRKRDYEIENSCSPEVMPVVKYGCEDGLRRTIKSYENIRDRV